MLKLNVEIHGFGTEKHCSSVSTPCFFIHSMSVHERKILKKFYFQLSEAISFIPRLACCVMCREDGFADVRENKKEVERMSINVQKPTRTHWHSS